MNQKNITDIICASYETFFDAEKKIGSYIINHKEKVIEMTVAELAKASGTSDATVSRFCKKCELKGFHHLKIGLAKELADTKDKTEVSNEITKVNITQSLKNILANNVEELTQTISMLEPEKLQVVLEKVKEANTVLFAAVGNTLPVALDGAYKFNQLGIKAVAMNIWETQLGCAMNLNSEDVVIVISNSGASKKLLNVVLAAKESGAMVIAITNNEHSPIAKESNLHLTTATREKLFMDEYCFSRISAMTVIEIFYLFLAATEPKCAEAIRKHEENIVDDKI